MKLNICSLVALLLGIMATQDQREIWIFGTTVEGEASFFVGGEE
jgi:hypothetical protein